MFPITIFIKKDQPEFHDSDETVKVSKRLFVAWMKIANK